MNTCTPPPPPPSPLHQCVDARGNRGTRSGLRALEWKVVELNAVIESMLRERQATQQANEQFIQDVADGYDSPEEGRYAALPYNGLVVHPDRWYSSA